MDKNNVGFGIGMGIDLGDLKAIDIARFDGKVGLYMVDQPYDFDFDFDGEPTMLERHDADAEAHTPRTEPCAG